MKAAEGKVGRVFVVRLEDGDEIPACLEKFAEEKRISVALVTLISGVGSGHLVSGPKDSDKMDINPVIIPVEGVHELLGTGIIAPGEEGQPKLHIHAALGRSGKTIAGCLRPGVKTWLVGEAVISEILDVDSRRVFDKKSSFSLLEP